MCLESWRFSFNPIKKIGNEWEMGNVLYIFIEVDLRLILFLKGEKLVFSTGCANSGELHSLPETEKTPLIVANDNRRSVTY